MAQDDDPAITAPRFTVHRAPGAAAFLERAEPFLLRSEAENNLILGIAARFRNAGVSSPDGYFVTVEQAGDVVGCAFRTPPMKLGLTRMPAAAAHALAAELAIADPDIDAVLGPDETARAFAQVWCARSGRRAREGMRQRIYQTDHVRPPANPPPGVLRPATGADRDLMVEWLAAFSREADLTIGDPGRHVDDWIRRRVAWLWVDGEPRAMAGRSGETRNGARVGFVYTPPAYRGRGYASACTAAVTRECFAAGFRFCYLYTDLANPTSNRIYQRMGYQPVSDALDIHFE